MPKKTKEQTELEKELKITKKVASKKPAKSKQSEMTASKTAKRTTTKISNSTSRKSTVKVRSSKKATTKKTTTKKNTSNKVTKKITEIVEYYDLPYRYNQTVVKVLAQTPSTLFIYWDISDKDRKNFEKQYGENFFQETKPVLIVHNDTLGYSFEVEINDFANSWYLHVADSKCDYRIELGRRPIVKTEKLQPSDFIYVTTSNEMESPNNKILLDKNQKMVYFRNVKTGQTTEKPITTLSFMQNMGKVYDIYDLYKTIYKNENVEDIYDLTNPSSHSSS